MIKDFKEGYQFKGLLMVVNSSRGVTNTGDPYINATLQDSSGQIEAKIWKATEKDFEAYQAGNVVMITGDVYFYKTELQLKVIESSIAENVNVYEFLAQPVNRNELLEQFTRYLGLIENKDIKAVLNEIFKDKITDFSFYPAATKNHHEYVSGLLHHTISMLKIGESLVNIYKDINSDYLYAGILLHDLGKLNELSGPAVPKYTNEGRLIGHISICQALIYETCEKLKVDKEIETILQHLVLSHHGEREYGSPITPSTLEAELIYLIDNIDSKHNMIVKALDEVQEGEFTTRILPLDGNSFYKPHKTK